MSDINARIRKLRALAEGTQNEHERESAIKIINELIDKYNITEQDFSDDVIATHEFKYKGIRERTLLYQVFSKVLDSVRIETYQYKQNGRKVSNLVGLDCTFAQKVEINLLFDFYKELYKKEEERFFNAFINKHRLCATSGSGKEISKEDYLKMQQLINGMEDNSPLTRLVDNG